MRERAVRHSEFRWGGFLPPSSLSTDHFLARVRRGGSSPATTNISPTSTMTYSGLTLDHGARICDWGMGDGDTIIVSSGGGAADVLETATNFSECDIVD